MTLALRAITVEWKSRGSCEEEGIDERCRRIPRCVPEGAGAPLPNPKCESGVGVRRHPRSLCRPPWLYVECVVLKVGLLLPESEEVAWATTTPGGCRDKERGRGVTKRGLQRTGRSERCHLTWR